MPQEVLVPLLVVAAIALLGLAWDAIPFKARDRIVGWLIALLIASVLATWALDGKISFPPAVDQRY